MLSVKDLGVIFESEPILQNINFTLSAGKILAVIGPNGSGKTTLLKSILGLQTNHTGTVLLNEKKISHAILNHEIGYLPQHHQTNALLPLTVFDVVAQGIKAQKKWFEFLSSTEKDKIRVALDKVKLWDRKDDLFEKLSGGQKQRVLLALALVNAPKFLFLDEPSSAMDVGSIKIIYQLLCELRDKNGMGILIISHDINGVLNIADEIALLMHEIKYIGSAQNVPQQAIHDVFGLHFKILSSDPSCDLCKISS
ncbi:MAG: metal ABC transporter ATP-binding protein [Brevinema sp.]